MPLSFRSQIRQGGLFKCFLNFSKGVLWLLSLLGPNKPVQSTWPPLYACPSIPPSTLPFHDGVMRRPSDCIR
ncbi:hypothetical protein K443DRAFT_491843 [Laccaria amethystina LaAM-08-1]|uniref:Uncharacterized protein n=1 Tax=Laccaria amethystina LaAM-08-1 TaxID=1095629 RepID=A0A0C9XNP8_9AGAR|nr:hypothetical protein K443DRAFT_491843 [Laccaria amethystina LaAM-08-1]